MGMIEDVHEERATEPTALFRHEARFCDGFPEELLVAGRFVREGIDSGDRVLVMLNETKVETLRKMLGRDESSVQFVTADDMNANPALLIPLWQTFADSSKAGGRCRGVTEPVRAGMQDRVLKETQLHESLLNVAFEETSDFMLLCMYDVSNLDSDALRAAHSSHLYVGNDSGPRVISDSYNDAKSSDFPWHDDLSAAPPNARHVSVSEQSLGLARDALVEFAQGFGMNESAAADCALAGHEVMANSIRHGDGEAELSFWRESETMVCEVKDHGNFEDPLAGRTRPGEKERRGRGLWMVNQLCDLVQIRTVPGGTAVRFYMRRDTRPLIGLA
jgi:anti-sigma regulatory factor (Ser/Thr protein kinase)